ncbi:MAG: phosphoethanolamine transferase [Synergistaceae bacterium]|jgi:heptose-I-phosphate ethanolaminephosphotransferase|nr:phosphoethanolamine transferase [Synergistaceae bacterium]
MIEPQKSETGGFYAYCLSFAFFFPAVVLACNYAAFPRVPSLLDMDLFQDFLIGGLINAAFLLPGMILPILILPCMLLVYGGVVVPTAVYGGYMVTFGGILGYDVSRFVWNTNWNQAYEFLSSRLTPVAWAALAFLLLFPLVLMVLALRSPKPANSARRLLCLLPLLFAVVFYEGYFMKLHAQTQARMWWDASVRKYFFRYYAREFYKLKNMDVMERELLHIMVHLPKENFPLTGLRRVKTRDVNGLVLVGESASRPHHGIYGYFRDTTPRLEAMSADLVVFNNAEVASSASTRSLLGAFSFVDNERDISQYTCSIFDILNEAGFETAWLTNSIIESIFSFAGGEAFVRTINSNVQRYEDVNITDENGKHLDEATLPLLRKILARQGQGGKGLFVRFNGSHMRYVNRYPAAFARFSGYPDDPARPWLTSEKKNIIDQYDNTILYTDHVVAEFIEAMKTQGGVSFVLYFSDHGEEVYSTRDFFGRVDKKVEETPSIMKVPLLLWFSDEYKRDFPEVVEAARMNLRKDFVLDDLLWTMVELYGLTFDGFRPDKSLVNAAYVPVRLDRR